MIINLSILDGAFDGAVWQRELNITFRLIAYEMKYYVHFFGIVFSFSAASRAIRSFALLFSTFAFVPFCLSKFSFFFLLSIESSLLLQQQLLHQNYFATFQSENRYQSHPNTQYIVVSWKLTSEQLHLNSVGFIFTFVERHEKENFSHCAFCTQKLPCDVEYNKIALFGFIFGFIFPFVNKLTNTQKWCERKHVRTIAFVCTNNRGIKWRISDEWNKK